MANEFVARKGLIVLENGARISGSVSSSVGVTAPYFYGDGSGLTNITAPGTISSSAQFNDPNAPFTGSFSGSFYGDGSNLIGVATALSIAGTTGIDSVNLKTDTLTFNGVAGGISASVTNNTVTLLLPPGAISSSEQIRSGSFSGSFLGNVIGTSSWATNAITSSIAATASYALASALPPGTVSSSEQIRSGSFTGSFLGNVIGTSSWATNALTASYALASALPPGTVSSSEQIRSGSFTGSFVGNLIGTSSWATNAITASYVLPTGLPSGVVSASSQIEITQTNNYTTFSSSLAAVDNTQNVRLNALELRTGSYATTSSNTFTGIQNITDPTNSTLFNNGALIVAGGVGIGKDVNISGSLTVTGLLTAVSMSTQYVTSSQLNVADNRIIVNVNDLIRFGGLSVIDSGSSSPTTASIYWDSLNHKFIYENLSGSSYNSAMFIAGPRNYSTLGNEVGLVDHRVPVAHGDDHIDSRPESSSIRIDFPSRLTHIEAGLVVTGSTTSTTATIGGTLYDGATTTNIIGPNTPSGQVVETVSTSGYDGAHFDYLIKDGTNFRTGTVMAVWSGASVVYTDTSTTDIGSTIQASFEVDLNGGNARLKFLVTSGTWTVKVAVRAL